MLRTETYDLDDERDRLDNRLDELAERSVELEDRAADLQGRSAGLDDDDPEVEGLQHEFGRLMDEQEDLQEEVSEASSHLAGIEWVIEAYGGGGGDGPSDPADPADPQPENGLDTAGTDGDTTNAADTAETDDTDGPVIPESVKEARASEGGEGDTGGDTDGDTNDTDEPETNPREPFADGGHEQPALTITVGGLNAGEYARVTDKVSDAQNEPLRVGGGQSSVEGASRIFYCASGLVDAPFLEGDGRQLDLDTKVKAVREVSPGLLGWLEDKITTLTVPSEAAGNGFRDRIETARQNRT